MSTLFITFSSMSIFTVYIFANSVVRNYIFWFFLMTTSVTNTPKKHFTGCMYFLFRELLIHFLWQYSVLSLLIWMNSLYKQPLLHLSTISFQFFVCQKVGQCFKQASPFKPCNCLMFIRLVNDLNSPLSLFWPKHQFCQGLQK